MCVLMLKFTIDFLHYLFVWNIIATINNFSLYWSRSINIEILCEFVYGIFRKILNFISRFFYENKKTIQKISK